jgi:hypothetical protein
VSPRWSLPCFPSSAWIITCWSACIASVRTSVSSIHLKNQRKLSAYRKFSLLNSDLIGTGLSGPLSPELAKLDQLQYMWALDTSESTMYLFASMVLCQFIFLYW